MIIKVILNRIRKKYFPTINEKNVKQWYLDNGDETLRLNYNLNQNSIVLDFGGYKGQWASDIFSKYLCNIMVFEPVKKYANDIKKRFELNSKIKTFQIGLGQNNRTENISLLDDGSSTLRQSNNIEKIQIVSVKEWFSENKIDKIDLIKINIEGGEYELLNELIKLNLISNFKNIQVQFHEINKDSEKEMNDIRNELLKTHKLTYSYKFVWENWELV